VIVVTGGAGFIGSNIVAALATDDGRDVAVCDLAGDGDKWRNLSKHTLADFIPPDELFGYLETAAHDIEAIVHMGAISSTTETDVDRILTNNFRLSLDLWLWCSRHEARFIYASSAATYGDGDTGFDDDASEDALARLRPLNPYGWSKQLFDRRVARLVAAGLRLPPQWAGLKFFNVYGPNEYHKGGQRSVAHQIFESAAAERPVHLFKSHDPGYADGGQMRDFVWVGDCVAVVQWLLANPDVSGLFNMGTGQARSFDDLARAVFASMGAAPEIEYIDTPPKIRERYQYFTEARMDRLRAAGYDAPFTRLEDGIGAYVHDYLTADDPYR
jgi:ADP-L-glycero-D-manno-heptose 6-epimerase